MENFLFYLMAAGAVAGALGVVLSRNPMASVLALLACFFCLATIYLLAGFQFLAAAQILVYAGAILVLFLFVIMLLNLSLAGPLPELDRQMFKRRRSTLSIATAAGMLAATAIALSGFREATPLAPVPAQGLDAPAMLASSLFGRYALPFEAASLLLLASAVAVLVLAKRDPTRTGPGARAGYRARSAPRAEPGTSQGAHSGAPSGIQARAQIEERSAR